MAYAAVLLMAEQGKVQCHASSLIAISQPDFCYCCQHVVLVTHCVFGFIELFELRFVSIQFQCI